MRDFRIQGLGFEVLGPELRSNPLPKTNNVPCHIGFRVLGV